ncbi:MAG: hypothetical protein AAF752_09290, partial [Bacteroidota bacterium]
MPHWPVLSADALYVSDSFDDDRSRGKVVGTRVGTVERLGADANKSMSISDGRLRIAWLAKPGWGKSALVYGPFDREAGLAFAVLVNNGHNASETEQEQEPALKRLGRRVAAQLTSAFGTKWMKRIPPKPVILHHDPPLTRSLAAGFYTERLPAQPARTGMRVAIEGAGPTNATLMTGMGSMDVRSARAVPNVPLLIVAVVRPAGVLLLAGAYEEAAQLGSIASVRPIGLDPFGEDRELYAGLHQSVLGQSGFQSDTSVYGARVAKVEAWSEWFGASEVADLLDGRGRLEHRSTENGIRWRVQGSFERSQKGTVGEGVAWVEGLAPAGLIHTLVHVSSQSAPAGLVWRLADDRNYWVVTVTAKEAVLRRLVDGQPRVLLRETLALEHTPVSLQIIDDGQRAQVLLDGQPLFGTDIDEPALNRAVGVGLYSESASAWFSMFESCPRRVHVPDLLKIDVPWKPAVAEPVVSEYFRGETADLDSRPTPIGFWQRSLGEGRIVTTGMDSARVVASKAEPNPGRTLYTLPWDHPASADLSVEITPPGTAQGEDERGRGGLTLFQDADHYLVINNWMSDRYGGSSVSCFLKWAGKEELYRAVWTNVGWRVHWGKPHTLRLASNGAHVAVYLDGQPILYRALSDIDPAAGRLAINRVGLAVNWEFGDDTGS